MQRSPLKPEAWIPHSSPTLDEADRISVESVLGSGYLARGPVTRRFEQAIGSWLGKPGAHAVASGTTALQLALLSLAPDDASKSLSALTRYYESRTVLIPAYVCAAVLYAVEWVGAKPVFVDMNPATWCVDPGQMANQADANTVAAIPAWLFGYPGEKSLPSTPFPWIEDIAQALGAEREGVAAGKLGQFAVCSFYATKVITTGTGGMVLCQEKEAAAKIDRWLQYDNHSDPWLHLSQRMGDFQASLGLAQWNKLQKMIQKRREIAEIYTEGLAAVDLIENLPAAGKDRRELIQGHIYFRYPILLKRGADRFIERMKAMGVEVKRPVYTPVYRLRGEDSGNFPQTERIFRQTVSLPLYPTLTVDQANRVIEAAKAALSDL